MASGGIGDTLLHNMLLRELVLVALILMLLIRFYFQYVNAATRKIERIRRRRTRQTLVNTRIALTILVVALLAVLAYDRLLPHFGYGAQAARVSQTSAHSSIAKISVSSSSTSAKTSSSRSSQAASSTTTSSSSSTEITAKRAVAIVKSYYSKHPNDSGANVDSYSYVEKGTDDSGAPVFEVGGFVTNQDGSSSQQHLYYVHKDGKFDIAY
jgi:cytoskeletal protein RodZ